MKSLTLNTTLIPLVVVSISGCGRFHSPTVDVLGSYFPAWLVCMLAGLVLTLIARLLLIAFKLAPYVRPAPVVYPCLAAVFTLAVWLLFFQN